MVPTAAPTMALSMSIGVASGLTFWMREYSITSIDRNSVRMRTSPGPGSVTGARITRKQLAVGTM